VPAVIQGHLNRPVPRLTEYVALPPAIDEVVRRGMAKSPNDRYPNCRALMAAARQALAGAPNLAPAVRGPAGPMPPNGRPGFGPQPPRPQPPAPGRTAVRPPLPPPSEPVRLRPPVAISSTAFKAEKSGTRWVAPVIVGLVAIGLIVAVILLLSSNSGDGGNNNQNPQNNQPQQQTSVPEIKVGGGGSAGDSSDSSPSHGVPPLSLPPSR
jgi:hypothetical protein